MAPSENTEILKIEEKTEFMNSPELIQTNVKSLFKVMAYDNDFQMIEEIESTKII